MPVSTQHYICSVISVGSICAVSSMMKRMKVIERSQVGRLVLVCSSYVCECNILIVLDRENGESKEEKRDLSR